MDFVDKVVEIVVDRNKGNWFLEGKREGRLEQTEESVRNMINYQFSDRDIAKLLKVNLKFVKTVRGRIELPGL